MYCLCTEDLSRSHVNSNINKLIFLIFLIQMLLPLYAVPLMNVFLRSGFASMMRGRVGSNTLSYEGPVTLCFVIVCVGRTGSASPMSTCHRAGALRVNTLMEQVCEIFITTHDETIPGVILNVWLISPNPSLKRNTVLI